jgi:hypothetical protein
MLSHQIEFSKAIAEIYKPISGRASDPNLDHLEQLVGWADNAALDHLQFGG